MIIMIILLILCLPLILMLSLFTTTNVVAVVADVPVTGIELHMNTDEIPILDIDKEDRFIVDYTVMPQGATNKEVTYSFYIPGATPGEDEEVPDAFEMQGNLLIPKTHGKFKVVITTNDGAFRRDFLIYVTTKRVTAIDSAPGKDSIVVGETTGIDTLFTPSNASNQSLNYTVKEGHDVVKVTNGKIKGIGLGTAVIEVSSGDNPDVKDEITVTVGSSGVFDFVDDKDYITVLESVGTIDVVVNPELSDIDHSITLTDTQGQIDPASVVSVVFNKEEGKLEYEFSDPNFIGEIEIALTLTPTGGEPVTKYCSVARLSDVEITWEEEWSRRSYAVYMGENIPLGINVQPKVADVTYVVKIEFNEITDLEGNVHSGDEITLTEGKRYTCDGGYISFMLVENTIVVYGERTVESMDKISDTTTKLSITAIDVSGGKTIDLKYKKITVIPASFA